MKLGYIHSSKEEQARAMQVLKMTSESVALDELGIGRIRDAFADSMFPGISTLQKHTKYFSLMPQVYRKATERRYNRLSEVKTEIVRLERIMTKNLYDGSTIKWGITGSDTIGKGIGSYVKFILHPTPYRMPPMHIKVTMRILRMTLGQPRQEELLQLLKDMHLSDEQLQELTIDLCPFNKVRR